METQNEGKLLDLVQSGKLKPNSVDKEGQTPLHIAVENEFSVELIDELVKLGCNLDAKNVDGITPLHSAMYNENSPVFQKLISLGANPDVADNQGETVRDQCNKRYKKL